jgi:NAD dependent epimerase/dehydratase family enzyme
MEAIRSPKTSVATQKTAQRHNTETHNRYLHRLENAKFRFLTSLSKQRINETQNSAAAVLISFECNVLRLGIVIFTNYGDLQSVVGVSEVCVGGKLGMQD